MDPDNAEEGLGRTLGKIYAVRSGQELEQAGREEWSHHP